MNCTKPVIGRVSLAHTRRIALTLCRMHVTRKASGLRPVALWMCFEHKTRRRTLIQRVHTWRNTSLPFSPRKTLVMIGLFVTDRTLYDLHSSAPGFELQTMSPRSINGDLYGPPLYPKQVVRASAHSPKKLTSSCTSLRMHVSSSFFHNSSS